MKKSKNSALCSTSDSLWELAAADVHQRRTEVEEEGSSGGDLGGGGEQVAERSVFLMGSKAGVSEEPRSLCRHPVSSLL